MHKLISQAVRTSTFRQTAITTISTFASAGLGAVFYLVLAKLMSPSDYGLFTLATTFALLIISIGDLGSGQSLIRFTGQNLKDQAYFPYALISLRIKILTGTLSLAAFYFLARPLAVQLVNQPDLAPLLPVAGLVGTSLLLLSFVSDLARGLQKFILWGGIQIGSNIVRLGLLGLNFAVFSVSPASALFVFALAPIIVFVVAWGWLDKGILNSSITKSQIASYWSYNKWTAAFIIASAVTSRMDTFVSARFLSLDQVGIYGLANTMAAFMPQLSGAFGAVTSAKFASFQDPVHAAGYLKKAILFTTVVSLGVAAVMIPVALAVIWFTGSGYQAAFAPFLVLLAALALFTSFNPLRDSIFYFHARPDIFFWVSVFQSIVIVAVGTWLIPKYGVIGSALTVLISLLFLTLVLLYFYRRLTASRHP